MGVKIRRQEGIVVVRVEERELISDEQILRTSGELSEVLDSTKRGTRLLLDLQDVEMVASMMLADLVVLNKDAVRKGVFLQICRLSSDVKRVMETCKLDGLFDILDDPPSAIT